MTSRVNRGSEVFDASFGLWTLLENFAAVCACWALGGIESAYRVRKGSERDRRRAVMLLDPETIFAHEDTQYMSTYQILR